MPIKMTRTGENLTIQVGPDRLAGLAQLAVFAALIFILCGVGIAPAWRGLESSLRSGGAAYGYLIAIIGLSALTAFLTWMAFLAVFSYDLVLVNRTELKIQRCALRWIRSRRSFPCSVVEKLRYEVRTGTRYMNRGIYFDCAGETVEFARGINERQAYRIIDAMKAIYPFSGLDPEPYVAPGVTSW